MKAMLITRCGCSKLIDIPQGDMELRIPLSDNYDAVYSDGPLAERKFRADGPKQIFDQQIIIYREV